MIAQKILNIMAQVQPVIKSKTNEEQGFDYAGLSDIILCVRESMIKEKVIMLPQELTDINIRGNDVSIKMIYRFFDVEADPKGKNEYIDVQVAGQGLDSNGWGIYKALSGAYKYALTQTFSIPTLDDAERGNLNITQENQNEGIVQNGSLNEKEVESIFGESSTNDIEKMFNLGEKIA